ncbi:MAG TPA: 3'-5' exonuclease [Marmoricola sp.]
MTRRPLDGLGDPDAEAYRILTDRHTLVVLDTETTPQPAHLRTDGEFPQRLIQLGTVTVSGGAQGRPTTRLVSPGVPVSNSRVHGLIDADLATAPDFTGIVTALDALLSGTPSAPPVVLVCHYAAYDVHVLRGEYARVGRQMPDVVVLDTIDLARYVGHDTGRRRSLEALAVSLDVPFLPEHDAGKDATATAACLVRLLRIGARAGMFDLDDVLAAIGTRAADVPPPALGTRAHGTQTPRVPADHLASHVWVLPADPDADTVDNWVHQAVACSEHRCPHGRDRAAAAARTLRERPDVARRLLDVLTRPEGLATLTAGKAGTHAGILAELVPAALVKPNDAIGWWREVGDRIRALPRCQPHTLAEDGTSPACPDCGEDQPCPLDTLHETVAIAECGFTAEGRLENTTITRLVAHKDKTAHLWARKGPADVAGHIYAVVIAYMLNLGREARANGTLAKAVDVGVHTVEPRVALLYAQTLLSQNRLDQIDEVLAGCSRPPGNTNPGYTDLEDWAAGPYATALARTKPKSERILTKPRQARPAGRTRPYRHKL